MRFLKDIISRIRWEVVTLVVVLVCFIALAVFFIRPFNHKDICSDDFCIRTYMDPDAVPLKGESKLWVELRNDGSNDINIEVKAKTRNPAILFKKNMSQEANRKIGLGAGERIRINFDVKANAEYPGVYRTDVQARYNNTEITDSIYLRVG